MRSYGPLSLCWTLRFEGKHSFFKKAVRRASNFKNLLRMLAERHQLNLAYHLGVPHFFKPAVEAFQATEIDVSLLNDDIKQAVGVLVNTSSSITVCKYCNINGTKYCKGMNVAVGMHCGIVQFAEVIEIILGDFVIFVTRLQKCEYWEHFRCIKVIETAGIKCIKSDDILFYYPLPSYNIRDSRFIMPKYYMCLDDGKL